MRIVMRIGGSVVASPVNLELIGKYVGLLKILKKKKHEIAVVVGGGALAREFIRIAKDLELNEGAQDELAISVSRLYAQLFSRMLGKMGCETIPVTIEAAADCVRNGRIAIMGGLKPGMTTDTVAALLANAIKAKLYVKATDQEGVYDKDPRKYSNAVKLDHLSFKDLEEILVEDKHKAGLHQIFDPESVKLLKKGKIRVVVVNGSKPENVFFVVEGKNVGTLID